MGTCSRWIEKGKGDSGFLAVLADRDGYRNR